MDIQSIYGYKFSSLWHEKSVSLLTMTANMTTALMIHAKS